MKYFEHAEKLATSFKTHVQTETSIAQLAEILNCSDRHVKTVVQYLHQEGYIQWLTQRGRGKKPNLTNLFSTEELCIQEAKRKVDMEEYHEAFKLIETLSKSLQNEFQDWFMNHFGLSQRIKDDQTVDVLTYPFYETKLRLDPMHIRSRHDGHMVQQIFDRLVEYDARTNQLMPRIAHHWESSDGKLWTFYLHKGIKFHHGRALTSDDVKASFERLIEERVFLQNIISIHVCSPIVIQIQLKDIDFLFPRSLSGPKTSIVPIEAVQQDEKKFSDFPIGSGPYKLIQHNKNRIQLDVFTDHFSERPWLDRIDIIKTPAPYQDEINHTLLLSAPDDSWKQVRQIEEGATYITFNCGKNGPMKDENFRKAICERLTPSELTNEPEGNEVVAYSFSTAQSNKQPITQVKSKEDLHYTGEVLKIAAQQIRVGANHEQAAVKLQSKLEKLGIPASVELVDVHLFSKRETFEKYDLFVGGIALNEDRLLSVITALQSELLSIYPCFDQETQETVDRKIAYLREIKDESARWDTYFQLENYLKEKHVILYLNHRYHTVYEPESSDFVNVVLDSNGRVDYRKVWKRYRPE